MPGMGRPRKSSVGLVGESRSMVGEERRSAVFGGLGNRGRGEEDRRGAGSPPLAATQVPAATGRPPLGRAPWVEARVVGEQREGRGPAGGEGARARAGGGIRRWLRQGTAVTSWLRLGTGRWRRTGRLGWIWIGEKGKERGGGEGKREVGAGY